MERISAYMDGEAGEQEAAAQLARLKDDPELRRNWETYHLIGDSLRGEAPGHNPQFMARFSEALAKEPTVLAPKAAVRRAALPRIALPLAASFGGIALVAWLALSNNPLMPGKDAPIALKPPVTQLAEDSNAKEYIAAHQREMSLRPVAMQEVDMR
jgi:sigma-E factor negative regulatory protein RseA